MTEGTFDPMVIDINMRLGVIEGFYGRAWSATERHNVASQLTPLGFSSYIYAPKSDKKLRSLWREPWSDAEMALLSQQAQDFQQCGVDWGLGLSPMGLVKLVGQEVDRLEQKLKQIALLKPAMLCVLFDDMPGGRADLAGCQLAIVDHIAARLDTETRLVICPTYYSFDPILEKLFSSRPKNYWTELGYQLDPSIGVFWTGDKVCSETYPKAGLSEIADLLRRKPVLWDNYPVNDSQSLSNYIRVEPFANRPPWLGDYISAHYVNPMNQATLSLLPLATLAPVYAAAEEQSLEHLQSLAWQAMLEALSNDAGLFEEARGVFAGGLQSLTAEQAANWRQRFMAEGSAAAKEVVGWLDGDYTFDPACLTE